MLELVAVALAAGGATVVAVWPSRDRLLRRHLRDTVVVNMKSRIAFRGVLFEADRHSLVLRNAEVARPGDDSLTAVDGEVFLPRADVEFVQHPGGAR